MMAGDEELPTSADSADSMRSAAAENLDALLSMPMGFAELALLAASKAALRPRSEYERYRLPSRN